MRRAAALTLCVALATPAAAEVPLPSAAGTAAATDVERAEQAYAGGDLAGARASARAAVGDPSAPATLEARARAVLAAVQVADGDEAGAAEALVDALAADPLLTLDPVVYPPDVRALADRVRVERREEIERRHRAREDALRPDPPPPPSPPAVAPAPPREPGPLLVAFAPFGAGQFQNGHDGKGVVLATSEAIAATAAVGGLAAGLALRGPDGLYAKEDASAARTWNVVWLVGAYGFLVLHGYGVVDAVAHRD